MSRHTGIFKISIVIDIVNDKTFFLSMTISSNFSEHLRRFSRKHGSIDDLNESNFRRHFGIL